MIRAKIAILLILIILCALPATAHDPAQIDAAKNYLYILVPSRGNNSGIFDGRQSLPLVGGPFSHLKQYLENQLNLQGYVYSYDFSKDEDTVEHWGWEIGDRNYVGDLSAPHRESASVREEIKKHKVKIVNGRRLSFIEQAREDFIKWKADNYYRGDITRVSPDEIPDKYIILSHCFGGSRENVHRISLSGKW